VLIAVEGIDGAGKSTLVQSLCGTLGQAHRVLQCRWARQMTLVFREFARANFGESVLYQDVLPDGFRRAAYLLEAATQFGHLHDTYQRHDVVVFDRWAQTAEVYCGPVDERPDQVRQMEELAVRSDLLLYVRADPATAYDRLVARGDPLCRVYSPGELRALLEKMCEGYERVMAGTDAVVLDGSAPPDEVLRTALAVIYARKLLPTPVRRP
jgi:thymidylate kinase